MGHVNGSEDVELQSRIRNFAYNNNGALIEFLAAERIQSFQLCTDSLDCFELTDYWIVHFPFGYFRAYRASFVANDGVYDWGAINCWLYGLYHPNHYMLLFDDMKYIEMLNVDWLDVSQANLIQVTQNELAVNNRGGRQLPYFRSKYRRLCDILGHHFIPRGASPYYYLFQTGFTVVKPAWSRLKHLKCDPHFRAIIKTVLLMIRFKRHKFGLARDLIDLLAGLIFANHCDWLLAGRL